MKNQRIVFIGPNRKSRYFKDYCIKHSKSRNVCNKTKSEILEEHEVTLAQIIATSYLLKVRDDLKANLDHTMLFVSLGTDNKNFTTGFGNGGLRNTQGEGATFTAVPIAFNGRIGGSFNVLSSGTKTGALSNVAKKRMKMIDLKPGLQITRDRRNNPNSVF